uniref:NAD(P)-binding domain-containing protein n=1 Tax=Fagus sylvatica TaxID=28930 RepID=A0A2N9ET13_FAGSY
MAGSTTIPSTLFLNAYYYTSSLFSHSQSSCKPLQYPCFKSNIQNRALVRCSAKKKLSFMDQILDYIEGGPKLRKWYGAPDPLSKDGSTVEDDVQSEVEEVRDAVLVTDGDSEIGQMVILSLIVKRTRIKAIVKDRQAALEAFGTYVESTVGDASDKQFLRKALRGVRTIICPNFSYRRLQLSAYSSSGGIQALMKSNARKLAEQDESMLKASGIPYTIIRAGLLQSTPGGQQGFSFEEGSAARGNLSKEDAAFICVQAVDAVPQRGFIFEVVNGDTNISDWQECLARLMEKAEQQLQ